MSKTVINGLVKNTESKGNGYYILNGDIETIDNEEYYIESVFNGVVMVDIKKLVKDMPLFVQKYINDNKKQVNI